MKSNLGLVNEDKFDPINQLILLSIILLSNAYCIFLSIEFTSVYLKCLINSRVEHMEYSGDVSEGKIEAKSDRRTPPR